jgi:nicotinamidase-related amidase
VSKRAIVVVDIQNEYFPGGKLPLFGIETAAGNAAKVIASARQSGDPVLHIRHEEPGADAPFFAAGSNGAQINVVAEPKDNEVVICKNHPNAFRESELKQKLDEMAIGEVVIVGAMSHMCVDATARAAADHGYAITVVQDACATLDLVFGGTTIPARQVHGTIMAALGSAYGDVIDTAAYLAR